jgi:hypothetical protein
VRLEERRQRRRELGSRITLRCGRSRPVRRILTTLCLLAAVSGAPAEEADFPTRYFNKRTALLVATAVQRTYDHIWQVRDF